MTFELAKILESKRKFRQRAASRPIEEKLAMLDALRERALLLRSEQSELHRKHKPLDQKMSPNNSA
jgi:hypothetical protein